jgi:mRNA interferase MazF
VVVRGSACGAATVPDPDDAIAAIPVLNQVLAVPATRTARGIPTEVPLGVEDGMPEECVLTLDNVTVIRPALCTDRITRLAPVRMREVCAALATATGC